MSSNKSLYLSLAKALKDNNADPFLAAQSLLSTAQSLGLGIEAFKEVFMANDKVSSPPPSRPRRTLTPLSTTPVPTKKKEKAQSSELDKLLDDSVFSQKITKTYKKLLATLKGFASDTFDPSTIDRANAAALIADIDNHLSQFQTVYENCDDGNKPC